jgi:hypothetical protein
VRRALLTAIAIAAVCVILLVRPNGPATPPADAPAPLPFSTHLSGWIDSGIPIAAVAEIEGRQFLILAGESEDESWSVAVDPGDAPEAAPAPVALGPALPARSR